MFASRTNQPMGYKNKSFLRKRKSLPPLGQLSPKAKGNPNSSHKALANCVGPQTAADSGLELSVVFYNTLSL
ncbi:hypothetical protein A7Q09_10650 [Methylacidiphilum sp. Yel]|jgi:hypothetical protein|nr:hypothetical protein A7Q09_10650 [Methylacidiphilum sp. Yel]